MNEHIFREYDIRGVVGTDLTPEAVQDLGRAIGTYLVRHGVRAMTVGRDCRLSSESLRDSLVSGLLTTGVSVTDIGVCHTPLLYFSLFHLNLDGGVMITGSHNPPEFNGFKVCLGKTTIHGEEIQKLKTLIKNSDYETGMGRTAAEDILPAYMDYIADNISLTRSLKVVVDAGNGTGGTAAVPLLKRLGCEVVELYCEMDGTFPHHHPDPTVPGNLEDLIATVIKEKADMGIGFDGDGDRIGAVDERGRIIWGDHLMIIFGRDILQEHPGATMISEVKGSQNFYNDITARGGRAIMWKTGHSLIKAKMKAENALLGGEMSGHMFFAHRYFGFDDAVYAACRLAEVVAKSEGTLSDLLQDVPKTFTTPEIRVECADEKKFAVIAKVKQAFAAKYEIIDIDGARIKMPGGWGLVRASNTQPVLVLRFEADSQKRLTEIRNEVEAVVNKLLAPTDAEDRRPWGFYQVLADEDTFKCKHIVVYPGKRLSLQRHQRRDEHWFILAGRALVTLDNREISLSAGQAVDIPRTALHRIENTGTGDVAFIEVQTGDYFGEDDIERLEDDFGRA
ncbi:cupin domain-containing protein [Thermodesulfobacteriota bacterium]